MAKIKIHELAKELNLGNKEVIEIANKLGLNVTSHLNAIEEKDANRIRENVKGEDKKSEVKTTGQVIIRREVIVSDEEEEKEKKKQEEAKKKSAGLGFNQKRNKDYNIVYREKPTKPMTVSELFGIKPKKEEKKPEPKVQEAPVSKPEKVESKTETVAPATSIQKPVETKTTGVKEQLLNSKENMAQKTTPSQDQKTFNKNYKNETNGRNRENRP